MKKALLALACGVLMASSAHAELPDLAKVWQDIQIGKLEDAKNDLDDAWDTYRASKPGKWKESHSEESSHDVEEWLNFSMIRFYIAYLEGVDSNIKVTANQIHQLSYLEFMGRKDRPN
jgi:hypothetical protein